MKREIYSNLDGIENTKGIKDMLRWSKERRGKKKDLSVQIPQAENKEVSRLNQNKLQISITWIGHSTFLIQMAGLNIITDPVWAGRMGVQKRLTEPGLPIESLPPIDIVLISHGHYDHLDFGTIKRLKGTPVFYVPIGLKRAFAKRGYKNIVEANWWESFSHRGLKLSFVPAQHWTKRSLTDTNTSHWGGWIMEADPSARSVYFVGDTGYFRGFKEIASRFDIDIVLMPIGAYEPEWFMSVSHINPEDSIKAFKELDGKLFIPMHYGAYRLADDTGPEALDRLIAHWEKEAMDSGMLKVLKIGETLWPGL
ncbi:MBL fold metallo-hydrolase [Peribacillus deserti]|uniref:MBL fold metallo-hydrolase n=1 Tax=Peribacillus deserti TaxID=673318 RepID=A0A2N5M887_9BACI|nr:MBL fold metallo-hydrolase [Peribacillus deserti]PLT30570.1 MBL fold metallo-hydrolase [Peribacillus deserti]